MGHGSTRSAADNDTLLRHAERLAERSFFDSVDVGLLYGEPSAKALAARLPPDRLFVVPFFMAGGFYPRCAVPALFGLDGEPANGSGPIFCAPIGLHPGLADLIEDRAQQALTRRNLAAREAVLLLVGHGSLKTQASWQATEAQARRIRRRAQFREIRTAYLEQAPLLEDMLLELEGPLVVVGFFAGEGAHAGRDIPELLESYRAGPVVYLGAIGADAAVAELVLDQVAVAESAFRR